MGIPRLTQDIAPFAETVILSGTENKGEVECVNRVVIDGPSLVFHIYTRVFHEGQADLVSTRRGYDVLKGVPLPYHLVNEAVLEFLDLLHGAGVVVVRIIFDGGLPATKHSTRLERLERSRQLLESYRQLNAKHPLGKHHSFSSRSHEPDGSLWRTHTRTRASSQVPIPPLIVPSVIERLAADRRWCALTEVVKDESDPYCAGLAVQTGAAVLSNDSDILVYDLGEVSSLVSLGSLELINKDESDQALKGSCLKPKTVASGLGIVSLQAYAYQRFLDGQATARVIAQRTRTFESDPISTDSLYGKFRETYSLRFDGNSRTSASSQEFSSLDPRTAELVCALDSQQPLRVYLPILFEDSTRDASWVYGKDIRQLAYSLLLCSRTNGANTFQQNRVTEFARTGRKIQDVSISIMSLEHMVTSISNLVDTIRSFARFATDDYNLLLMFHAVAARTVQLRKSSNAKSCMLQVSRLMSLGIEDRIYLSWDDIHILANMQAVLYSLRMLKQLSGYVVQNLHPAPTLREKAQDILRTLANMPSIENLFLDANQLCQKLRMISLSVRIAIYHQIEPDQSHPQVESRTRTNFDTKTIQQGTEIFEDSEMKKRNRHDSWNQSKRSVRKFTETSRDRSIKKPQQSKSMNSNNPYALLDQE